MAGTWGESLGPVVEWMARSQPLLSLSGEIEEATRRISDIVKSLKTYSYLGQAPGRDVDLVEGIESTLVMLRSKLKDGVTVVRHFAPDLPRIDAFGTELNQVWTNIIDNAVHAMAGHGTLTLRTRREDA